MQSRCTRTPNPVYVPRLTDPEEGMNERKAESSNMLKLLYMGIPARRKILVWFVIYPSTSPYRDLECC
jgi:hypothetical protein